jgi:hypothetical protein
MIARRRGHGRLRGWRIEWLQVQIRVVSEGYATMMLGAGALGVWHGVAEGREQDVDAWYDREHHAERISIPGFLRARRYVNLGQGLRYFSRYDVLDVGVLASAPYLAALDAPSPWSQLMFPHYRHTVRGAFKVQDRRGPADGGIVATLRFSTDPLEADDVRARASAPVLAALAEAPGVLRVEAWAVDVPVTAAPTREKALRTVPDARPAWALVIDGSSAGALQGALDGALPQPMRRKAVIDLLQLVFHVARGGQTLRV